jgi:hypothetical protein
MLEFLTKIVPIVRTNKVKTMDDTKKMTADDVREVANAVGCSERNVKMVINGERGARGTKLQKLIIKAMDLRLEQKMESHKKLIKFCKSKRVKRVVPQ